MPAPDRIKVLITGPLLSDPGGVANYYSAVLPYLNSNSELSIEYVEIGKSGQTGNIQRLLSDQLRVNRRIQKYRPDVVHVNPSLNPKSFFRDALFVLQAKFRKVRVLVFFRGWDDVFERKVDRWLRWFFRLTFARSDGFVVLADRARSRLSSWGVKAPIESETTVVPDSLLEAFDLQEKLTLLEDQEQIKVLFMARVELAKGVLETIDAVVGLVESGKSVSLTIAGDGDALPRVRREIQANEVARAHVNVVGYATGDMKRHLLATHHIYCLPSYHGEGMPNAMLEAMAFGMPVITCAVGGIADMFQDRRMGSLVQPRDPGAISEAIDECAKSWNGFEAIARFNHDFSTRNAMASGAAARLSAIYARVVGPLPAEKR